MILTTKEMNLIHETKEYWIENIQKKFLNGAKAKFNCSKPIWEDGEYIKAGVEHCPMCREYFKKDGNCLNCLFIKCLGKYCVTSGGRSFCRNPNLETCNEFILNFDKMLKR